jgi:hypothetical protein
VKDSQSNYLAKLKKIKNKINKIVHKVHAKILPLVLISVKFYYILDYLIYLIQKNLSLDFNMGLKITIKTQNGTRNKVK